MNEYEQALTMILKLEDTVAELLQQLEDARDAIASLDEDALGWGTTEVMGHEEGWPIRDEMLDYINKAIRKAKGE